LEASYKLDGILPIPAIKISMGVITSLHFFNLFNYLENIIIRWAWLGRRCKLFCCRWLHRCLRLRRRGLHTLGSLRICRWLRLVKIEQVFPFLRLLDIILYSLAVLGILDRLRLLVLQHILVVLWL